MFDKESFKKYISAGSSNPIYYFKRRGVVMNSRPSIGDERSVPEFQKERKCLNRSDTFSELIQLSLKICF